MNKYCTQCGNKLSDGAKFCAQCGTSIIKYEAEKPSLQNEVTEGPSLDTPAPSQYPWDWSKPSNTKPQQSNKDSKPTNTHAHLASSSEDTPPLPTKSRSIAAALAFFLGSFGLHKFYLNKPGMGILYAIFFWTYVPMIIGAIEGIIYAMSSDDEFDKKHNSTSQ